jgi:hypothetical protein
MSDLNSLVEKARAVMLQEAGGSAAGELEISKTSVTDARAHAERVMKSFGRNLDEEVPNFDKNYRVARDVANTGKTKRKDMPVIGSDDVREFQRRLKGGYIDVSEPFRPSHQSNPFPEGLKGREAKEWLESGLPKYDGDLDDDKVSVQLNAVKITKLSPIQKQIYFDESMRTIGKNGAEKTKSFLSRKSILICSSDLYIIDGHHRFLSGMLVDPSVKTQVLMIDLPIATLLPMATAYGDAIGNKRNL